METHTRPRPCLANGVVVSLPMRDGNKAGSISFVVHSEVVSLPMRDGNILARTSSGEMVIVVSLPMRDGNLFWARHLTSSRKLLAYL